jgi:D-sedoheptulose 7-phosphate isomerase
MNYIENLTSRYPELKFMENEVKRAIEAVVDCYKRGGKILLCGNGGSAADSEHISGELLKGFMSKRRPTEEELAKLSSALGSCDLAAKLQRGIPAIPLTSLTASLSAFANDVDPELVFAQLVFALSSPGDLLMCLSTSGNSLNVVRAAQAAKALGLTVVSFTGEGGGKLLEISDLTLSAPEKETYKVQEYHLPIYHAICAEAEKILFG